MASNCNFVLPVPPAPAPPIPIPAVVAEALAVLIEAMNDALAALPPILSCPLD